MKIKQQQNQMLSAIFSLASAKKAITDDITLAQNKGYAAGLEIYQRSLLANANRALAITFATVHSFIGASAFKQLVNSYLQAQLKIQYDWGELGADFPGFIKQQAVSNCAILADIATLDFACHQAERAEDIDRDLSSLSALSNKDAYQLTINFAAGFRILSLNHPVDLVVASIKSANESNNKLNTNNINKLLTKHELTSANTPKYYYLIWRPKFQAQYQQITPSEYQWLALWQSKKTLPDSQQLSIGDALDSVTASTADKTSSDNFSIVDWLPKAIKQQLINSITVHSQLNSSS